MAVITRRNWLAALTAGAASMPVRMEAQQPARQPLDLSEYQPKSMLRVHETKVDRARYPVIHIHTHLSFAAKGEHGVPLTDARRYAPPPTDLLPVLDRVYLRTVLNLAGGFGHGL